MHDLYFAKKILDISLNEAAKYGFKIIKSVKAELGEHEEHDEFLNVDNVKFNFGLFAKGTIAENAKLFIKKSKDDSLKVLEIDGD